MGNQPSRRTTGRRTTHSRKFVRGAKESLKNKNYSKAAKIAVGAGLKEGGVGVLAASILAAAKAYSSYKESRTKDISKITSNAVRYTIKSQNFKITREGRTALRSSIRTALSESKKK